MRWDTDERKKENEDDRGRIVRGGVKQIEGKSDEEKGSDRWTERMERHRQSEGSRERYRDG